MTRDQQTAVDSIRKMADAFGFSPGPVHWDPYRSNVSEYHGAYEFHVYVGNPTDVLVKVLCVDGTLPEPLTVRSSQ